MPTSRAEVRTETPARYAKQLTSHLGRRIDASWDGATGVLPFPFGTCELAAEDGVLVLAAEAATDDDLARVEDVAGSHLERFGQRNELTVTWTRS
ncbi:MAG: DUF2218 domain-containing protein [Streptosporangiales bacterium]|nr:DUF2218 domain-containing protein [Streptosporangiales bacterium]MBO0889817.1 DUF2218 domain-containing protein [Acidothermales bacterium]